MHPDLERLLRDSYANYVVQTALEHASEHQRALLVEAIKPFMPAIRSTPYGRRLQSKLHGPQLGNIGSSRVRSVAGRDFHNGQMVGVDGGQRSRRQADQCARSSAALDSPHSSRGGWSSRRV